MVSYAVHVLWCWPALTLRFYGLKFIIFCFFNYALKWRLKNNHQSITLQPNAFKNKDYENKTQHKNMGNSRTKKIKPGPYLGIITLTQRVHHYLRKGKDINQFKVQQKAIWSNFTINKQTSTPPSDEKCRENMAQKKISDICKAKKVKRTEMKCIGGKVFHTTKNLMCTLRITPKSATAVKKQHRK